MAFNYSGDPSESKLDECRFLLGDTDSSEPILQDEEIEYLISKAGSNLDALYYELFSRAANKFARQIRRSLGPQSEDPTSRLEYFKEKANEYKHKMTAGNLSLPSYSHPKIFNVGMHSNPPWRKGRS